MLSKVTSYFKDGSRGIRYHIGAIVYSIVLLVASIMMVLQGSWVSIIIATICLAHSLTVAAYMIHECAHNTVFKDTGNNARLGRLLMWYVGASYVTYEQVRYKHFRHHVDNDDVVSFDNERFMRERPKLLASIKALEFFYIPAHDMLMHWIMVFNSIYLPENNDRKLSNLSMLLLRGLFFIALAWVDINLLLVYIVAYIMMITVLRFMDSLQHDYPYNLTLYSDEVPPRKGDKQYEREHTYSNPLNPDRKYIDWLVLNFGFHNAHHERPTLAWYQLTDYHRQHFGQEYCIAFKTQCKIFHRYRVARILNEGGDLDHLEDVEGGEFLRAAKNGQVYGGNAASFLTPF